MKNYYVFIVIVLLIFQASCVTNKAQTGAVGGAAGGALLGQAIGKSTEATLIGAAVGTLLGYAVGNEMDKHDRAHLSQVYETSPSHQETAWVNPDSGNQYSVTPKPAYKDNVGRDCREAEILTIIDGKAEKAVTTACRENGRWVVNSSGGASTIGDGNTMLAFTTSDTEIISSYYRKNHKRKKKKSKHMPPGLAKKNKLPPGLQKQLVRNGRLPAGLQKRYLPVELESRLSPLPKSYARVVIGSDLVLMNLATNVIIDILYDIN